MDWNRGNKKQDEWKIEGVGFVCLSLWASLLLHRSALPSSLWLLLPFQFFLLPQNPGFYLVCHNFKSRPLHPYTISSIEDNLSCPIPWPSGIWLAQLILSLPGHVSAVGDTAVENCELSITSFSGWVSKQRSILLIWWLNENNKLWTNTYIMIRFFALKVYRYRCTYE